MQDEMFSELIVRLVTSSGEREGLDWCVLVAGVVYALSLLCQCACVSHILLYTFLWMSILSCFHHLPIHLIVYNVLQVQKGPKYTYINQLIARISDTYLCSLI